MDAYHHVLTKDEYLSLLCAWMRVAGIEDHHAVTILRALALIRELKEMGVWQGF
ncbi:hypothetical protein NEUTE1DRAFT_134170 [Neurospora tetrasperma FGSC 2508]|uniref:Uncharacterized protein n=1 Tax=Neurospora tetrasperma (strain FGSC 2508 / ATCC MYA-4615 / P0657) TaxID=510951 RepID=F8MAI4_NEUT8|nr:uncharacterized protein NEUTE1DRAFT_134170 [Neurospora tetrasperma FGSC 2508]EGO60105.1 hypothetical protein NEUTE1DRAFT_134170 [Neurospora tetrasperma FGSC 2508]EGZ75945.1 hypothetical protein NEUTE2DRAFT_54982 [Neurospora tetrasperma FGSC 2509]